MNRRCKACGTVLDMADPDPWLNDLPQRVDIRSMDRCPDCRDVPPAVINLTKEEARAMGLHE